MQLVTPDTPLTQPLSTDTAFIKVLRCLNMLDLIDSQIIASGNFSTPFDQSLEALRSELTELVKLIGNDADLDDGWNH